jgi:hypothetical protein
MSWLSSLVSMAGSVASSFFCATFSKQSPINLSLGINGATTLGQLIYLNSGSVEQLITNLKVNFRLNGVSAPPIEIYMYWANLQGAGTEVPQVFSSSSTALGLGQELQAFANLNPTLAVPTLCAWAIIMVRQDPNTATFYDLAQAYFTFTMLTDFINQNPIPSYANITNIPNIIVYLDYTVLYGHETWRDFQIGFQDQRYPGPLRMNPQDWLQLITFGSGNFDRPEASVNGVWGRLAGLISLEVQAIGNNSGTEEERINAVNSNYKLFTRP